MRSKLEHSTPRARNSSEIDENYGNELILGKSTFK